MSHVYMQGKNPDLSSVLVPSAFLYGKSLSSAEAWKKVKKASQNYVKKHTQTLKMEQKEEDAEHRIAKNLLKHGFVRVRACLAQGHGHLLRSARGRLLSLRRREVVGRDGQVQSVVC